MKKILNLLIICIALSFSRCKEDGFGELGLKEIYLVGSGEPVQMDVSFDLTNEKTVSAYCSGTELPDENIEVNIQVDKTVIEDFNGSLGENDEKLIPLPESAYSLVTSHTQILKGKEYGLLHFSIDPSRLDGYNTYGISFRLANSNPYPIDEKMSKLIYRFKLINQFTGVYRMVGSINGISSSAVKSTRAVSARSFLIYTDNKSEIVSNSNYRIAVEVNDDNSLVISSKTLNLLSGGGVYRKDKNTFDLNYSYIDPITKETKNIKETLVKDVLAED